MQLKQLLIFTRFKKFRRWDTQRNVALKGFIFLGHATDFSQHIKCLENLNCTEKRITCQKVTLQYFCQDLNEPMPLNRGHQHNRNVLPRCTSPSLEQTKHRKSGQACKIFSKAVEGWWFGPRHLVLNQLWIPLSISWHWVERVKCVAICLRAEAWLTLSDEMKNVEKRRSKFTHSNVNHW